MNLVIRPLLHCNIITFYLVAGRNFSGTLWHTIPSLHLETRIIILRRDFIDPLDATNIGSYWRLKNAMTAEYTICAALIAMTKSAWA